MKLSRVEEKENLPGHGAEAYRDPQRAQGWPSGSDQRGVMQ